MQPTLIKTRLLDFVLGYLAGFLGGELLSIGYNDPLFQGFVCSLFFGFIIGILTSLFGRKILKYLMDGIG